MANISDKVLPTRTKVTRTLRTDIHGWVDSVTTKGCELDTVGGMKRHHILQEYKNEKTMGVSVQVRVTSGRSQLRYLIYLSYLSGSGYCLLASIPKIWPGKYTTTFHKTWYSCNEHEHHTNAVGDSSHLRWEPMHGLDFTASGSLLGYRTGICNP